MRSTASSRQRVRASIIFGFVPPCSDLIPSANGLCGPRGHADDLAEYLPNVVPGRLSVVTTSMNRD